MVEANQITKRNMVDADQIKKRNMVDKNKKDLLSHWILINYVFLFERLNNLSGFRAMPNI